MSILRGANALYDTNTTSAAIAPQLAETVRHHEARRAAALLPSAHAVLEKLRTIADAFTTDRDRATFYAGVLAAEWGLRRRVRTAVRLSEQGEQRIQDTPGGRLLSQWIDREIRAGTLDDYARTVLWDVASRFYAERASGKVACFIPDGNEHSAFFRVELPCLIANERVTHINCVPNKAVLTHLRVQSHSQDGRRSLERGLWGTLELLKTPFLQETQAIRAVQARDCHDGRERE